MNVPNRLFFRESEDSNKSSQTAQIAFDLDPNSLGRAHHFLKVLFIHEQTLFEDLGGLVQSEPQNIFASGDLRNQIVEFSDHLSVNR